MTDSRASTSFFGRNEFLIRRLHSLTGLVPVGAYMCVHLLTNASVLDGTRSFQTRVDQIHSLGGALPAIEWTFIFLPIIFHAVAGIWIATGAHYNTSNYPIGSNVRYTLQRATAWIATFFIFYHVFHMHGWIKGIAHDLGGAKFDPHHATSSAASALQASFLIQIFYAVGILSCVFHLANGIWTAGITWGVWTSPAAQKRATYACAVFGVLLALVGMGALGGLTSANVEQAQEVEGRLELARKIADGEDASEVAHPEAEPAEAAHSLPTSGGGSDN